MLNIMHTLVMEIQRDGPSRISVSRLDITITQHKIKTMKKLEVIDVSSWNATNKSEMEMPRVSIGHNDLQDLTKKLMTRLDNEFQHYFPEPASDQKLAILLNPVMAGLGLRWLQTVDKKTLMVRALTQ